MKKSLFTLLTMLAVPGVLWAAGQTYSFNIPAQSLDATLKQIGVMANRQVLFSPEVVAGRSSNPVVGNLSAREALETTLAGSGLVYEVTESNVLLVKVPQDQSALNQAEGGVQLAQAGVDNVTQNEDKRVIEEITVTATKRETSLQDTPMSITAVGSEEIARRGLVSGADYLNSVPGVKFFEVEPGTSQITMRGISTSIIEQATVSSYLGEVPLNSSLSGLRVDLKLVDLERVEVLRGPQGTLFGGGSLSGAVRNIPNAPKLDRFEGSINVGSGLTAHSGDVSYNAVGVLNVPIVEDKLAFRVATYHYDYAGYKDFVSNPFVEAIAASSGTTVADEKDVNTTTYTGARGTLLWQPTERLEASLVLGVQDVDVDGGADLDIAAGGYQISEIAEVDVSRGSDAEFANLTVNYALDWAMLTGTFSRMNFDRGNNYSLVAFTALPARQEAVNENDISVQEIRLSSQFEGPLQFVAGLYNEEIDTEYTSRWAWLGNLSSFQALGIGSDTDALFKLRGDESANQQAVFGEINYELNDRLSLTFGGRWFQYERENRGTLNGSIVFGTPLPANIVTTEEDNQTFKASVDYAFSEDVLLYTSWSQGYRVGKGQVKLPASICDTNGDGILDGTNAELTDQVDSDSTTNYELGAKVKLLENRLTVNAALYQIDWTDIPILVLAPSGSCAPLTTQVNGGEARSKGGELEAQLYITDNLKFILAGSFNDSEFLDDGIGNKGDRLPQSPKVNGNIAVEYAFGFVDRPAFFRADYNYVGSFYTDVNRSLYPKSGGYGLLNARAGIELGQFSVEIYGNNITNEDALMGIQAVNSGWRLHPRVVGVEFGYNF